MVRGTGKFKQKRGGGRNFSKDLEVDAHGVAGSRGERERERKAEEGSGSGSGEEGEEDSDEEEEEESEPGGEAEKAGGEAEGSGSADTGLDRVKRKALRKQKNATADDEEDADLVNPNRPTGKKITIADLGAPRELSRREREQKEKADAKERYWKLHLAGKTDEAKADLGRLAQIRKDRELAQAKRKAEAEAKASELKAKKDAQLNRK